MADANIRAVITAKDEASSTLRSFGDGVGSLANKLKVGFEVAGVAAVGFGALSVKAFSESEDLIAQTNAVLKSTGEVAGVTAGQVTQLAIAWQKQSKYSDEAVRGAENILLTFTHITKDIFPQTLQATLDISTALHEDLQSAAIQVGKALQDPILGVTALRRVGVNFSQQQRDLIKTLVDTGQAAKAQQIILKELNTEFGGSAEAAGATFSGSMAKIKNSINDVQEKAGLAIVQALTPFAQKLADVINNIDWDRVIKKTVDAIKTFIDAIKEAWKWVLNLYQSIETYVMPGLKRFWGIVTDIARVIKEFLLPSIEPIISAFRDRLLPQIMNLWNAIEPGFTDALKILGVILGVTLIVALKAFLIWADIFTSILGAWIRLVADTIGWLGNLGGAVINMVKTVFGWIEGLVKKFESLPLGIKAAIITLTDVILGPFKIAFEGIAKLWNSTVGKLHFTIPKWVPGIGGKGWDVPDIPMLAEGGIVTQPTLALIGEAGPEAVVPLNKGGGAGTININFSGVFMGNQVEFRKFAMKIHQAIGDAKSMGTY